MSVLVQFGTERYRQFTGQTADFGAASVEKRTISLSRGVPKRDQDDHPNDHNKTKITAQLHWPKTRLFAVICGLISTFWSDFVCKLYANNEKSTYVFRCKCLIFSVTPSGFKPETFWSVVRCSIQLSYGAISQKGLPSLNEAANIHFRKHLQRG